MKQEATKKPKKLLWLWIGLAALVLIAGAVLGTIFLFGGEKEPTGPVGGRPDLYWNLDKEIYTKDSESGLSTREAGEDGVFRVRFAYNGEQVELPVVDKQLVNFIDTMDVMGLVKDADGMVVDVIAVEDVATPVAQNAYVQQVMSDRIIANSSIAMNGMQYTIELTDLTQIYDVSDTAEVAGQFIDATAFQAMDSIWVYANDLEEVTHIYMTDHPQTSAVYWRSYQMWNSAEKSTSRVPDENGVYSIDFCSDGGIVTLKCKDKSIVTSIDNKSPHSCHFGFVFDEEGYIIEIMNSGIGIRGAVAAERIEVTELDGNYFSGSQLIPSDAGLSYSATLPEGCIIYDASSAAEREGRQGEQVDSLKLGDRICVWTDPMGTPVLVYIANRIADADGYFNLERLYDGTKLETKRETDAYGYYVFEMVKGGEIGKKILKTKDKEIATFIDSIANRIVGLKVENGIILNAYKDDDIYGWTSVYGGYVPQIQGMILSLVSFSKPDSPTNILMSAGYKAYDVSGKDVPYGTETTVRLGDIITVTRDVSYNGVCVYVTRRMVGGDNNAYYNLDYQYNSTTKETKRLPDADGYYVFTMAHKGKQVTVKTKDKDLANKIDKSPNGDLVCIMRVSNGIAYELYEPQAAYGQVLRSGYRVKSVNGDGTISVYASSGTEYVIKIADDCIMYNVSYIYDSHRGERCYSIKPGDMVTTLADYRGNAKLIYVRQRCTDNIYVNKQRMYDTSNKVTLREPDAEGKYWFELAVDGQVKKFWTKNKVIATQADSYSTPFGARIKGDELLNVTGPTYAGKARNVAVNGWDVTSVSKWSIGLQFNKVGYSNTGEKQTLNLGSNVKVYDISPTAKQFGEKVELKKGDRILAYSDIDKNVCYIYVLFHDSRVKGSVGYCEHCKKEVKWLPWAGGSFDGYDGHYYLAGNVQYSAQSNLGNQTKDYEIVLDLNGYKYEAIGSRGFLIRYNDTLTILDSVGGGSLAGTGINGNGGTILMASGGILNLYSGTLTFVDSENASVKNGAVIHATSSTVNVYGGTISGGIVNTSATNIQYAIDSTKIPEPPALPKSPNINVLGGNVHLVTSTLNLHGGVIENGQAIRSPGQTWEYGKISECAAQGGNVYASKNSVINLYEGAEIRGGYSNQHGGNVFITTSTLNMLGGKIYNGKCDSRGGNLYNQFGGYLNVESGIMEKGTATEGNNVYGSHNNGKYNFTGGTVTGDIKIVTCEAVSVSGTAKITKGIDSGLILPSAVDIKLGELKKGAEVYVNATGAFTLANNKAQAYVEAGYIKPASPRTEIKVENDIMIMAGEISFCEHCGQEVAWNEWPGTTSPASGHYFIGKDFKQVSQISIVKDTDVVIDLYGNTYSSTKIRNFLVRGTLSIMDTVGGGEMVTTCGAEFAGGIALVGTEAGSERPSGFNLYSGTLRLDTEHPDYASFANGGLISFSGGELNIYGGTMIGGHVTQNGGVIRANGANSVINIMGGTISGGTAGGVGGCIYSLNTVNVFGGTVDGEIYIEKGVSLIGGAPVIGELTLAKGALIDINGLEEGASIGVNADGVFTSEVESPADYLQYVRSADPLKDILPVENALISQLGKGFFDKYAAVNVEAEKMTENGVFANGGNVVAVCPACEAEVEWVDLIAYVEETGSSKVSADGHYYLSDNVDLTTHYSFYSNSCLHLNGHNITSPVRAIYVEADHTTGVHSHLNIMGDGIVTGAGLYNKTVNRGVIDVGGSVNFYGGTYVASDKYPVVTARGYYGNNVVGTCVVNIYDGAEFIGKDVNLLVRSQAVNVYGGKFTSGTNYVDGAATTNSLNIYGGTFSNDGVVFEAAGAKGTFNITGGTFDGKITIGADLGTFSISGAPVISELDLNSGKLAVFQTLTSGAQIAVNTVGAFTDAFPQAKAYLDAGYIKAAKSGVLIREEDGVLIAEVEKIYCEHCGEMVEWKTWPGISSPVSGHYYIDSDFKQASQYSIVNDTDVVIDLRGHTYSSTKIRNFLVRGKLSIVDSVGGGQMVTTGGAAFAGGIALVGKDSATTGTPTFNLYSGTLKLDTQNPDFETFANGGLFWVTGDVEMNVYGGTLIGGNVSEYGGAVKVQAGATLNVYSGTITGGTADIDGGCVALIGANMNMAGGEVDGDVFIDAASANVAISGSAKIKQLTVEAGALVDVSGLTEGAQIGVKATGVFTKPLTNANEYLNYFTNKDNIFVKDNALVFMDAIDIGNAVHTVAEKMTADGVLSGGNVTANCPVCNESVTWKDLNALMPSLTNNKITESGHYYLSDDANISTHFSIGDNVNVCLHLNGHNITSPVRAIYTQYNVVNIMGEGIVTGGYINTDAAKSHWASTVDCSGNLNLYGGTYTGTSASAVVASRSNKENTISMYEGASIVRDANVPGLSVMVYHFGDFIMYGGSISGGTSSGGSNTGSVAGNVYIYGAKASYTPVFAMYGGVIENGTAALGGNIYAAGPGATIEIRGGSVLNGSVYAETGAKSVLVSGTPVISDLNLTSGKKLVVDALEVGANIQVTANGAFTDTLNNAANLTAFFGATDPMMEVAAENNALVVRESASAKANLVHEAAEKMTTDGVFNAGGVVTAICPVCGTEEQWEDLSQVAPSTLRTDKHYYLSKDTNATALYNFTSNACLHLNGHSMTSTVRTLYVEGLYNSSTKVYTIYTLNIMGKGVITGGGVNHATIPKGTIDIGGNVNLYGGTIVASGNNPALCARGFNGRSVVNIYDGAEIVAPNISIFVSSQAVNVYGGKISSGTVKIPGASVASFNVYDGSINSNVELAGTKGTLTIAGGEFTGKVTATADAIAPVLSGAPVIAELDLTSGKKISVGFLKAGAEITVTADGAFTDPIALADKYVAFFKSAANDKQVVAEGNTLAIANK